MPYFQLATWEGGVWAPQFGDTDRDCVEQERQDTYLRQPGLGYPDDGKFSADDILIVSFKRMPTEPQVRARLAELSASRQMREAR